MNRVLVAGGAGFIGSHLCKLLVDAGHRVLCLDNFFTGQESNVQILLESPNFELIRHDIVQPIMLEVDQIYNLACPASPVHYQFNPIKTVKTNVIGTMNLLGLCKRVKGSLLQASTSEVYGDPEVHPQREDYWGNVNPIGLRSCYDEGKRVAETLCMDYHREHGLQVKVARIFNTYGPNMSEDDGRVISNFVVQALRGRPISIYGDGSQTRSFCYVADLISGFYSMMNNTEPDFTGPINLGNPKEFTMLQLAEIVIRLTNSSSQIEFRPLPQDDPKRRRPDISRARQMLGWEPTVDLEDGLRATIEYFEQRLSHL